MPLPQYTCVLVCTPPAMKVHPCSGCPSRVHMCHGMHTPSYEGTPPVVDAPPPVHMCPGMHTPSYEGTPPVVDVPPQYICILVCTPPCMKVHPNAIKIGNPTSQCALLGLKLVQLSTLAGRIFFLSQGKKFGWSWGGLYTEYIQSKGAYKLCISSVRTPSELCPP